MSKKRKIILLVIVAIVATTLWYFIALARNLSNSIGDGDWVREAIVHETLKAIYEKVLQYMHIRSSFHPPA